MSQSPAPPVACASFPRPVAGPVVLVGTFFFKWRNLAFPLVFIAAAAIAPPHLWRGSIPKGLVMDLVGLGVASCFRHPDGVRRVLRLDQTLRSKTRSASA